MPLWGMLAISAATGIYGAHKAAGASEKAADQQVASTEAAKADLAPIYEQSIARMEPYNQLGGQALGQLGALSGFPALPPAATPGRPVQIPFTNNPMTADQLAQSPMPMMLGPNGKPLGQIGGGQSLGALANTGGGQSSYGGGAGGAPPMAGQQGPTMITVQAPTGETKQVPEAMWPQIQAAGGKRVA